jgi:uncharacterized protein YkwD
MAKFINLFLILLILVSAGFLIYSYLEPDFRLIPDQYQNIDPLADKPIYDISKLEEEVHIRVNNERIENGLTPLDWDSELSIIARGHSKDMADNDFFEHENLLGESPTDRGFSQGYNCTKNFDTYVKSGIAENIHQNNLYTTYEYMDDEIISYNWSSVDEIAQKTVDDWMDSPPHRKNILGPDNFKEGIGVFVDEDFKVFVTENFC